MHSINIMPAVRVMGEINVPGDKSISHRAVMLGAIAEGETKISGFLAAEDCLSTIACFRSLGVESEQKGTDVTVMGRGLYLKPPAAPLDAGNSGTTARLMMGILAGQPFTCTLTGDASLRKRPMRRVTEPLSMMGAAFEASREKDFLPLSVTGKEKGLKGIDYKMPVASAQVKSSILLGGLYAGGPTQIEEIHRSRDHTERMLEQFGVPVAREGSRITLTGPAALTPSRINVPGDISSAAFFMVAAAVLPGSKLTIKSVGINPTRTGIINILKGMGALITLTGETMYGSEPVANITVEGPESLKGIIIGEEEIPSLIDEIPVIAVAALRAKGRTVIKGAGELRVKESDRISALTKELSRVGAKIEEKPDGMLIEGGAPLKGNTCQSHGDHRLAMALAIAGLITEGRTTVRDAECINISFPPFRRTLQEVAEEGGIT